MKIQRYMHDHGISRETLIRVAEKAFRNGSLTPTAWRQTALSWEEIENAPMVSEPLNKFMFCSPAEGGCALIVCRADIAHQFHPRPIYLKTAVVRSRNYGSFEVFSPSQPPEVAHSPTVTASQAAFELAGVGPEDIDVAQLQDTEVGPRSCTWRRTGSANMATRKNGWPRGLPRSPGDYRSIPTAGASPMVSQWVPQVCGKFMRSVCSFAVRGALVRWQAIPK